MDEGHDGTEREVAEQNEDELVIDRGAELSTTPVEERNSFEEETAATQVIDADASQPSIGIEDVKMAASQGNETLYIGNICKLWTKELVLGALKSHGVVNIEDILLPGDTKKEGKIKGFALLEFSTHSDATAALEQLRKSDVTFGLDSSANIAFAETPIHPNEEVLSELKTVFIESLADSWDQEKVIGICKPYGEIVKVKLSRIEGTKGKNFGYITFVSRQSAIACVDGINNTKIGERELKVKASIAQSHSKGRLEKRDNKDKVVQIKNEETEIVNGKVLSEPEFGGGKSNKRVRAPSKVESTNRKRNNEYFDAGSTAKKGSEHDRNRNSSKKQGKNKTRQSEKFRKQKKDPCIRKERDRGADYVTFKGRHAPGYPGSTLGHQNHVYDTISGSKRPYADMEPHAGFIDPVNRKHGRTHPEHLKLPVGIQHQLNLGYLEHAVVTHGQPRKPISEPDNGSYGRPYYVYHEPAVLTQSQPPIRYPEPAVRMYNHQSYTGYIGPALRGQDQSHAGHFESTLEKYSHNPFDVTLSRIAGRDGHGGGHSAYRAGSALAPSYVPNFTRYAPHEVDSTVGARYQGSSMRIYERAYQ